MRNRKFTLVEFFVVIAVIAILTGILLPALNSARQKGYQISCTANLKQIGSAGLGMYTTDFDDWLLPLTIRAPGFGSIGFPNVLNKFYFHISVPSSGTVCKANTVFNCSADSLPYYWTTGGGALGRVGYLSLSYQINKEINDPAGYPDDATAAPPLYRISRIRRASAYSYLQEGRTSDENRTSGIAYYRRYKLENQEWKGFRHGGGFYMNLLFMDGHVASVHKGILYYNPDSTGWIRYVPKDENYYH